MKAAARKMDLNSATEKELMEVDGIGADIAKSIVELRENNGCFLRMEELKSIEGIGEGMYDCIIKLFVCKMNINSATEEELMVIDGIGIAIAQRIVELRKKNGCFKQMEELKSIEGIGEGMYGHIEELYVCRPVALEPMETYRRRCSNVGDMEKKHGHKFHVGYIVARNNGGPDHPDNYHITPVDVNRRIRQDKRDDIMFWLAGREKTARAIRVARIYGANKELLTVAKAEKIRKETDVTLHQQFQSDGGVVGVVVGAAIGVFFGGVVGAAVGGTIGVLLGRAVGAVVEGALGGAPDWKKAQFDQGYCERIVETWRKNLS